MTTGQIPNQTYVFPDNFDEYVLKQIGIIVGHQGFDNNILMAEGHMKLYPQINLGFKAGYFDNIWTKTKLDLGLNEVASRRLRQIWRFGTFIAITRNEDETIVTNREVIYPINGKYLVINKDTLNEMKLEHIWETITGCEKCGGQKYVQLKPEDLDDLFPTGVKFCVNCGYEEEIEIERKPSLKEMELVRPKHSSPVWREIQGEVPMRYAHEDADLVSLASNDGGFYDEFADGRKPKFTDIKQILTSEDTTCFPSKVYYESSMQTIFDEFLHYFNIHLIDIVRMCNHRKQQPSYESSPSKLKEIFRETSKQE
jgi:hypothetical protein